MSAPVAMLTVTGAVIVIACLLGARSRPSTLMVRVERELAALRGEVGGYWVAHEHLAESLERRLDDLEQTTARAANEVRMVSDQVMIRLATEPAGHDGERV